MYLIPPPCMILSSFSNIDDIEQKRIKGSTHAGQIGLYTDMHFKIWCNVRLFTLEYRV